MARCLGNLKGVALALKTDTRSPRKNKCIFWQDQCQTLAMQNVCAKGAWVLGWDGVVMKVSHLVHGFSHVYSFKGSLLASHGFQFYWLQRPLWLPMSCQAVIPPHQYHNAAIPISKQGTIPCFSKGFILQV